MAKQFGMEYPVALDEGRHRRARLRRDEHPHCFVIDKDGKLAYKGAIDNGKFGKNGDKNYVKQAVEQLLKGETVTTPETAAYGCSVKYADKGQSTKPKEVSPRPDVRSIRSRVRSERSDPFSLPYPDSSPSLPLPSSPSPPRFDPHHAQHRVRSSARPARLQPHHHRARARHFLAARWAGIRVLAFAVGFRTGASSRSGRARVARVRRARFRSLVRSGETPDVGRHQTHQYRLNILPLGGYVKMLGQDDSGPERGERCSPTVTSVAFPGSGWSSSAPAWS